MRHDAGNDDDQCTDIVEIVVHQIGEVTNDEQQSAQHNQDDTQVLFVHNIMSLCVLLHCKDKKYN